VLLFDAVKRGDVPSVSSLLASHGALVNALDVEEGRVTPLHWAANEAQTQIAEVLLAHGAEVDAPSEHGNTPLHVAAARGHSQVAQSLIDHGADVNARNDGRMTPLARAERYGRKDVAALLREHGGTE